MWARGPEPGSFPIGGVAQLLELFRKQVRGEPDLALLSIVVGAIENGLTEQRPPAADSKEKLVRIGFPEITYEDVKALYDKFVGILEAAVGSEARPKGSTGARPQYATRALVKRVSDAIWNSLTRSYYKDRAHLQSLYSYLTGRKLDCFGVAFAVVAACQVLGFADVHLALSEDHAWVVFGENGVDTAEVTWHGKGNEDKRGQPIGTGAISASWLYVAGHPVVCDRHTEVAALVSSINPSLSSTVDVYEVADMQHALLWFLYDQGYLSGYPMALGNLGELEEASRYDDGKNRPNCSELFLEAIKCARKNYSNRHVYPYTYQGAYFFRNKMYKEAFGSWADAGDVIRAYNYSRDDEEIYKEFLEIANELIPQIMKSESSGHSARSILKDPQCFAHLLRFYDGICKWEEESQTPILHIGWAKPLVNTISKFDAEVRAQVNIICHEDDDDKPLKSANDDEKPADSNVDNAEISKESDLSKQTLKCDANNGNDNNKDNPNDGDFKESVPKTKAAPRELGEEMEEVANSHPTTTLYSQKMKGLKNLLLAEKLNTHAISLHLTAQSQVFVNKKQKSNTDTVDQNVHCSIRPKRVRRE